MKLKKQMNFTIKFKVKDRITEKQRVDDPDLVEYSRMDKGEELDLIFFDANGISEEGTKFQEMIRSYKAHVIQVFASKFPRYTELVEERFNTGDLEDMVETERYKTIMASGKL